MKKSRGYTLRRDPGGLRHPFAGVMYALIGILIGSFVLGPAGAIAAGWYWQQPAPTGGWPANANFTFIGIADNVTGNGTSKLTNFDNVSASKGTFPNVYGSGAGDLLNYRDAYINRNIIGQGGTISNYSISSRALTFGTDNTYDIGASGASRPRALYLSDNLVVSGVGPHALAGNIESDSQVSISGAWSGRPPGDNRAFGITSILYPNPVGGGRSSEGINVRPSIALPPTGNIASIEGVHVDLSGYPSGYSGLWDNTVNPSTATVESVFGFRVRGVTIPPGANTVAGIVIDAGLGGGANANYNIFSNGVSARNRLDGIFETWGPAGHLLGSGSSTGITPYTGLTIAPLVTDNTGSVYGARGVVIAPEIRPPNTRNGYGTIIESTFKKSPGGSHSDFSTLEIRPPIVTTDNTANVSNVTTLKITGASTEGVSNNQALWIEYGQVKIGSLQVYDNNAAASSAGWPIGALYRTSTGVVMIRY